MANEKLNLEELKEKGLIHLAELLESKSEEDEDDVDYDDEDEETETEKKGEKVEESAFEKAVEGLELQEGDIAKMKEAFIAAVEEKAAAMLESKLEALNTKVEKALEESQEANDKHIANYLDFVVEGWVKDNQVELERQVKVDLAESFMSKLKALFVEHEMILESDETVDQIAEAKAETASVQAELEEAVDALAEAKKEVFALQVEKVIADLSEGMTETQKERFAQLVGEVDVEIKEGVSAVREKLLGVKEIFTKEVVTESEEKTEEVVIEEEVQESEVKEEIVESEAKPQLDEKMASYVKSLNRGFSARHR